MAAATSAMLRTWAVRLLAIKLTLSARSFHVPRDTRDVRLATELALGADFTSHARDLRGKGIQLIDHGIDGVFNSRVSPFTSTVIFRDKSPRATAVVTSAILRT